MRLALLVLALGGFVTDTRTAAEREEGHRRVREMQETLMRGATQPPAQASRAPVNCDTYCRDNGFGQTCDTVCR